MAVQLLTRQEWGAGPLRSGRTAPHAQFVGIVVHHTVFVMGDWDSDGFLHGDLDDIKRYMRTLQHMRPDLGDEVPYSWVCFEGARPEDCVLAEGRGFRVTGAHTQGYNSTRYGVAVAGNSSTRPVTPGMLEGYRWVGRHLHNPTTARATIGHRDTKSTECPGSSMYAALPQIQPPFTSPSPIEEEDEMNDAQEAKLDRVGANVIQIEEAVNALTAKVAEIDKHVTTVDKALARFRDDEDAATVKAGVEAVVRRVVAEELAAAAEPPVTP